MRLFRSGFGRFASVKCGFCGFGDFWLCNSLLAVCRKILIFGGFATFVRVAEVCAFFVSPGVMAGRRMINRGRTGVERAEKCQKDAGRTLENGVKQGWGSVRTEKNRSAKEKAGMVPCLVVKAEMGSSI